MAAVPRTPHRAVRAVSTLIGLRRPALLRPRRPGDGLPIPCAHHEADLVPKINLDGERKLLMRSGLAAIDPLGTNWFPTEAPSRAHFRAGGLSSAMRVLFGNSWFRAWRGSSLNLQPSAGSAYQGAASSAHVAEVA
jgi:hypothetical protein